MLFTGSLTHRHKKSLDIRLEGGILRLEVVEDIPLWRVDCILPEGAAADTLLDIYPWVELVGLKVIQSQDVMFLTPLPIATLMASILTLHIIPRELTISAAMQLALALQVHSLHPDKTCQL